MSNPYLSMIIMPKRQFDKPKNTRSQDYGNPEWNETLSL